MEEVEEGPGVLFKPFITMEDLLDKLKLLDYEVEFSSQMRMRPLNRWYLHMPSNKPCRSVEDMINIRFH